MNKILIIQTAFIGDVVLTMPLIEQLTVDYSKPVIDFLTIPSSKNLLENHPDISNLIIFDKKEKDKGIRGLIRVGKTLAKNRYDICVTPHRSLRSAYLSYKSGAQIRIGFTNSAYKRAFTYTIEYRKHEHEIKRNLSLINALGFNHQEIIYPKIYPDKNDILTVEKYISFTKNDLFAIAPGSIWPTKRWPLEYYKQVCEILVQRRKQVILIGGMDDITLCEYLCMNSSSIISLAGQLTLRQTYYLLSLCSGLLTNDSAPLHLGMAAAIPVYAIFGPTVPEFGFAPLGMNGIIIENKDIKCRPCGIHGHKKCPTKTFDCMETITPEKVIGHIINR